MDLAAFRKPWVVAVALAIVGITGAVVVNAMGRRIHAEDRVAIEAFRRDSLPHVERARRIHASLARRVRANDVRAAELLRFRIALEESRRSLDAVHLASILVPTAQGFYSGVGLTLRALSFIERGIQDGDATLGREDLEDFDAAWNKATRNFVLGDVRFGALLCRARSPFCED